jgi:hypothetical protein
LRYPSSRHPDGGAPGPLVVALAHAQGIPIAAGRNMAVFDGEGAGAGRFRRRLAEADRRGDKAAQVVGAVALQQFREGVFPGVPIDDGSQADVLAAPDLEGHPFQIGRAHV